MLYHEPGYPKAAVCEDGLHAPLWLPWNGLLVVETPNPCRKGVLALKKVLEWLSKKSKWSLLTAGAAIVVVIIVVISVATPESPERKAQREAEQATKAAEQAVKEATKAAEEAEDRRKGFHCLSKWDGNHEGLEALVRDQLNDPGSKETYSTKIAPVNNLGKHGIIMDFGARNAFGGMVRSTAMGWINSETCEAELTSISYSGAFLVPFPFTGY